MLTVNKTPAKITSELINTFNQELIILVNEFRQLQDVTGSVVNNLEYSVSKPRQLGTVDCGKA